MGISRGQFIKLERSERNLTERTLGLAAKAFAVSRGMVLGDLEGDEFRTPLIIPGNHDIPVFAAAEAGPGEMVISTDPIEVIPRPSYLGSVKEGYAVLVVGESMWPAFRPGDLAIINPRLPPARQSDVVLVSREAEGEFTATIKHLIRWTEKDWYLLQFNPAPGQKAEFTLSRKTWPKALRIVGKQYGG